MALAGVGAVSATAACGADAGRSPVRVGPESPAVAVAERAREQAVGSGRATTATLTARQSTVDLGGVRVSTWTYGDKLPGQEIRLRRGDTLRAEVINELPQDTSVHWHGIALRNDMDGVPGLTQDPIGTRDAFTYDFVVPDAGTHWFHPHVGMQFDRGLYAPLIVEDPEDGDGYDLEAVLVLDDWVDGVDGRTPERELAALESSGMSMTGMSMGEMQADPATPLGPDTGDVRYPYYLINGRLDTDPMTLQAAVGQRIRLRIINAGADTAFRFAVGDHRMTVTHSDGYPVEPVECASLLVGMGERYDVVVTVADGVFPIVASAEGKQGQGRALLRSGTGEAPERTVTVPELAGAPLTGLDLRATDSARLDERRPDRSHDMFLGMDMSGYTWTINGQTYDTHAPLEVRQGQRVRLRMVNQTAMFHPMHLHGHTFQVDDGRGTGPRKDTVLVLPNRSVTVVLDADNPGQWLLHCHNLYHGEAGMMTSMSYVD
ncbi:multicopper oxidase family protein [Rhodococcus kroppenstedtii]|uniref:multicopper oxidase family protein n=1 Tax=Rhodococcoides kroppenstedtii TaxID=293050 RepID=UPI002953A31B|nr:multicopper oxidase family protein [Rhodococcus kroppenstedtii]MDV7199626.1 multicopper oxidase family protein [Rhodococcus kroppenstedtii]